MLSNFASYTLLRLEINVCGAAVIGFVGAGGIRQDLLVAIRKFYYSDVSAMLLLDHCLRNAARHDLGTAASPPVGIGEDRVSGLRVELLDDAARLPPPPRTFSPASLILSGSVVLSYVVIMILLGVTPGRLVAGIGRFWSIVLLMLPPSPGSAEHFWTYLYALGQTLAIAFVGTSAAAILALPLGFVVARNVVAGRIVHFFVRRVWIASAAWTR